MQADAPLLSALAEEGILTVLVPMPANLAVLDAEELLRAKADPEHHQNLIVRVGGYSDYFTRLSADLQDNIIARTMQRV